MTTKSTRRRGGYWLGFDLGGTKMLAAVYDADFRLCGAQRAKTKGVQGTRQVFDRLCETVDGALDDADIKVADLRGIGVGCPGPLDLNRGVIMEAPNLGWHNVPLRAKLQRRYRCPVTIANDVDAGTYGEYRFGAGQNQRCVLGVFPGTGIGGACVYEGRLIRGRVGSCMEIGHLVVEPQGRLCGCGQRGCLETVASRLAISAEAAAAAYRGEAPRLLELAGTDLRQIKSSVLARAISGGDEAVRRIVKHAAGKLGAAVAGVVNLLAPDVVVMGGGLVEALPALFLREVQDAVRRLAMQSFADRVAVAAARLEDYSAAMGAAALAAETAAAGARHG